ncbi:uncharacterized protein [Symphalangus syndactylus]|uniref:uncharacterized protein n=1 Tax=Symphalangus syndactylus TaxID=9590 RepID=UPI0024412454|nr:uncharacterized protein LOC129469630 [Symphalangus syndactylus]
MKDVGSARTPRQREPPREKGWGGERVGPPRDGPAGLKAAPSPPLPPTRLPSPRPLSPQPPRPLSPQPPPPQPPVPPRPDSPPLAKPDRAEPASDTRNQPPRPRPRLARTGCPSQSTPTCPLPPPILGQELQTGALFGQWQQGAGSCVLIPPAKAGREGRNERTNHEPETKNRVTNPWVENKVGWNLGQIDTGKNKWKKKIDELSMMNEKSEVSQQDST